MNDDMSEDQASADTPPAPPVVLRSPGAMIREARERARISIEELASQIKLAKHTLEALERDDFGQLLEPVYVRGYYRKCAKVLNLSEGDLISAYHGRAAPKEPLAPSKLRLASGTELGSDNRLPVAMSVIFVIIAIFLCTIIWNMRKTSPAPVLEVPVAPPPMPPPSSAIDASAPLMPDEALQPAAATPDGTQPATMAPAATAAPAPALPATASPATSTPSAPASATPAPATPAAPATATSAAPGIDGSATLSFTSTSWVSVEDATGKTLLNGLLHAGDSRVLTGKLPLKVFLGNAPAVGVQFQGQAIDVSQRVAENLTVRFTLPLVPKP